MKTIMKESGKFKDALKEESTLWHSNEFGHLECLKANYITHSFAPHTHDGFAIGVIERGEEVFKYRGSIHRAGKGQIILLNPAEVHDGSGVGKDGWAFSIFYVDPKILLRTARELTGHHAAEIPFFNEPVIDDMQTSQKLLRLHRTLKKSVSALERESAILETFTNLLKRHSPDGFSNKKLTNEPRVVSRVKSYLEENYADNVSLAEISRFAFMSQYHLIRVFKKSTGMSPYSYLEQIRIKRAKELLRQGMSIAEAALELNFTDQSHFTKTFKRFTGTTPGRYVFS